jgi:hypothetical protein
VGADYSSGLVGGLMVVGASALGWQCSGPVGSPDWVAGGRDDGSVLRLAYLAMANTFALIRLLPMSDRDKDWTPTDLVDSSVGEGRCQVAPGGVIWGGPAVDQLRRQCGPVA